MNLISSAGAKCLRPNQRIGSYAAATAEQRSDKALAYRRLVEAGTRVVEVIGLSWLDRHSFDVHVGLSGRMKNESGQCWTLVWWSDWRSGRAWDAR